MICMKKPENPETEIGANEKKQIEEIIVSNLKNIDSFCNDLILGKVAIA